MHLAQSPVDQRIFTFFINCVEDVDKDLVGSGGKELLGQLLTTARQCVYMKDLMKERQNSHRQVRFKDLFHLIASKPRKVVQFIFIVVSTRWQFTQLHRLMLQFPPHLCFTQPRQGMSRTCNSHTMARLLGQTQLTSFCRKVKWLDNIVQMVQ